MRLFFSEFHHQKWSKADSEHNVQLKSVEKIVFKVNELIWEF